MAGDVITIQSWIPPIIVLFLSAYVAYDKQKSRADRAEFELKLRKDFDEKLQTIIDTLNKAALTSEARLHDFTPLVIFQNYIESHARERALIDNEFNEHRIRHRDWKHDFADPTIRTLKGKTEDLEAEIKEIKEKVEELKEGQQ